MTLLNYYKLEILEIIKRLKFLIRINPVAIPIVILYWSIFWLSNKSLDSFVVTFDNMVNWWSLGILLTLLIFFYINIKVKYFNEILAKPLKKKILYYIDNKLYTLLPLIIFLITFGYFIFLKSQKMPVLKIIELISIIQSLNLLAFTLVSNFTTLKQKIALILIVLGNFALQFRLDNNTINSSLVAILLLVFLEFVLFRISKQESIKFNKKNFLSNNLLLNSLFSYVFDYSLLVLLIIIISTRLELEILNNFYLKMIFTFLTIINLGSLANSILYKINEIREHITSTILFKKFLILDIMVKIVLLGLLGLIAYRLDIIGFDIFLGLSLYTALSILYFNFLKIKRTQTAFIIPVSITIGIQLLAVRTVIKELKLDQNLTYSIVIFLVYLLAYFLIIKDKYDLS